ncbi:MAG: hypothetical protein ACO4BJ_07250 [Planctomycetota bacterium]
MKAEEFVRFIGKQRASAILRTPHGDRAVPAMEAAARAGFRALEFTLTIPGAFEALERAFAAVVPSNRSRGERQLSQPAQSASG